MSIIAKHIAALNDANTPADGRDFDQLADIVRTLGLTRRRIDHETIRHAAADGSAIIEGECGWDIEGRVDNGWQGVDGPATRSILRRRSGR